MSVDRNSTTEGTPLLNSPNGSRKSTPNGSVSRASSDTEPGAHNAVADHTFGLGRGIVVVVATAILVFLQATNISMLTTIQSAIAADLDAYELVTWFTSAYLVSMSSFAPVMGRLSATFSPRRCIFVSSIFFAFGALVTASASTFEHFIVGRAIAGAGGAGTFSVALIIVLQLASTKRRGLYIGLMNAGFTIGVSLGAIAAGAFLPKAGWVELPSY